MERALLGKKKSSSAQSDEFGDCGVSSLLSKFEPNQKKQTKINRRPQTPPDEPISSLQYAVTRSSKDRVSRAQTNIDNVKDIKSQYLKGAVKSNSFEEWRRQMMTTAPKGIRAQSSTKDYSDEILNLKKTFIRNQSTPPPDTETEQKKLSPQCTEEEKLRSSAFFDDLFGIGESGDQDAEDSLAQVSVQKEVIGCGGNIISAALNTTGLEFEKAKGNSAVAIHLYKKIFLEDEERKNEDETYSNNISALNSKGVNGPHIGVLSQGIELLGKVSDCRGRLEDLIARTSISSKLMHQLDAVALDDDDESDFDESSFSSTNSEDETDREETTLSDSENVEVTVESDAVTSESPELEQVVESRDAVTSEVESPELEQVVESSDAVTSEVESPELEQVVESRDAVTSESPELEAVVESSDAVTSEVESPELEQVVEPSDAMTSEVESPELEQVVESSDAVTSEVESPEQNPKVELSDNIVVVESDLQKLVIDHHHHNPLVNYQMNTSQDESTLSSSFDYSFSSTSPSMMDSDRSASSPLSNNDRSSLSPSNRENRKFRSNSSREKSGGHKKSMKCAPKWAKLLKAKTISQNDSSLNESNTSISKVINSPLKQRSSDFGEDEMNKAPASPVVGSLDKKGWKI